MMWHNSRWVENLQTGRPHQDYKEYDTILKHKPWNACEKNHFRLDYFKFNPAGNEFKIELSYSSTDATGQYWKTTCWSKMSLDRFFEEVRKGLY